MVEDNAPEIVYVVFIVKGNYDMILGSSVVLQIVTVYTCGHLCMCT